MPRSTLTALGLTHTIEFVLPSAFDGDVARTLKVPAQVVWSRWTGLWRRRHAESGMDTDVVVAAWKAAWSKGAQAQWKAAPSDANPYAAGQERMAWEAGWRWAQQNPDRRNHGMPRLAHRRRRTSDSTTPLTRALQVGAMGVTVFWVSRALHRWATGARQNPNGLTKSN